MYAPLKDDHGDLDMDEFTPDDVAMSMSTVDLVWCDPTAFFVSLNFWINWVPSSFPLPALSRTKHEYKVTKDFHFLANHIVLANNWLCTYHIWHTGVTIHQPISTQVSSMIYYLCESIRMRRPSENLQFKNGELEIDRGTPKLCLNQKSFWILSNWHQGWCMVSSANLVLEFFRNTVKRNRKMASQRLWWPFPSLAPTRSPVLWTRSWNQLGSLLKPICSQLVKH